MRVKIFQISSAQCDERESDINDFLKTGVKVLNIIQSSSTDHNTSDHVPRLTTCLTIWFEEVSGYEAPLIKHDVGQE